MHSSALALPFLFLLAILHKLALAENDASDKFFEVVFLDYVHEYSEVYASVDIAVEADYQGFLCGSPECQDKYELFASYSPHFRRFQTARILLTNDENLFQQISQEGVKFCLTKLQPESANGNSTLCYIRYKGKGKSGSTYQFYGNEENQKPKGEAGDGYFSAEDKSLEESAEESGTNNPLIELNKGYKKAKSSLEGLYPQDTNGKAAKQRLEAMLDAVLEVISAKIAGSKMTKSEAKKKLLRIHVDKVASAFKILGQEDIQEVLAFDQKYGTEAREYLDSEYINKQK